MPIKRFRTQRQWHNTLMMVWGTPFLILPGIIVGASSGSFRLLQGSVVVVLLGVIFAAWRDTRKKAVYLVDDDRLVLVDKTGRREVFMTEIRDASLLDRMAARAYLRNRSGPTNPDAERWGADFIRFCTVDIGLRSFTLGGARRLIDRLPSAKTDLLLVRLQNGGALLLSPVPRIWSIPWGVATFRCDREPITSNGRSSSSTLEIRRIRPSGSVTRKRSMRLGGGDG